MCGIVGFAGRGTRRQLLCATQCLAHRGPDFSDTWLSDDGEVGLGHRRLSIIELSSAGDQPMATADGRVVIVFNGEIYNFRQLRVELQAAGVTFNGGSDTEVLLQMYLVYGYNMLSRLNGIFAFGLWDEEKHSLFIARDALGVKPLYYAATPIGVAFASEIKALRHLAPDLREIDAESIHRYLTFLWCPGAGTPIKGLCKLLPGEAMIVQSARIAKRWNWYELPATRGARPNLSEREAVDGTADTLRRAVKRQLVADVPVGAFLSGGLDSSAVVAFAREVVPDIRCFTIEARGGNDAGADDDLPYARKVAAHLGVPLDVVTIDPARMASDLEAMVVQLDEPLADPAPLNVLYISQLARRNGIKVVLSGAGGDDLFTGYRRHTALKYETYLNWLPAGITAQFDRVARRLDQRRALSRKLAKLAAGAGLRGDARIANYFTWARESDVRQLYTEDFRGAVGRTLAAAPMLDFLRGVPGTTSPVERMLALDQRFFLPDHNLNYTDKMSMAAGVEVRVPFLDLEMVELAAKIPVGFKQRGAVGKWVLKKAMEPYLPKDIIYRPKTGFGAPLRRWMRRELRPLLGDLLSESSVKRRGIFHPDAVQRLIRRNDIGEVDAAYLLLAILNIEIWCRSYIDTMPSSATYALAP